MVEERYAGVKPGECGQVKQPEAVHALVKTLSLRDQHNVRQKRREDDERDCYTDVDEARYHRQAEADEPEPRRALDKRRDEKGSIDDDEDLRFHGCPDGDENI